MKHIPMPIVRICRLIATGASIVFVPYWLGMVWRFAFKYFNVLNGLFFVDDDPLSIKFQLWFVGFMATLVLLIAIALIYMLLKYVWTGK